MRAAREMPKLDPAKAQRVADLSFRQAMNVIAAGPRVAEKVQAVDAAAEQDPERFGRLLDDVERTGRVDGVYRRLSNMQQADRIRAEPPPLPTGPFRVIAADWPSAYEVRQENPTHRGILSYPTMNLDEICALPVARLAHATARYGSGRTICSSPTARLRASSRPGGLSQRRFSPGIRCISSPVTGCAVRLSTRSWQRAAPPMWMVLGLRRCCVRSGRASTRRSRTASMRSSSGSAQRHPAVIWNYSPARHDLAGMSGATRHTQIKGGGMTALGPAACCRPGWQLKTGGRAA